MKSAVLAYISVKKSDSGETTFFHFFNTPPEIKSWLCMGDKMRNGKRLGRVRKGDGDGDAVEVEVGAGKKRPKSGWDNDNEEKEVRCGRSRSLSSQD